MDKERWMSAAQRIPGKMQQWAWAVTSEELRGEEAVENPGTEVRELCQRQAVHLEQSGVVRESQGAI